MSTVEGQSVFNFEKSTLKVSFLWKFNDHQFTEYMEFNKLCKTGMSSSEEIRFQHGFLAFTDHYIQCYITDEDYNMYLKVCVGEPDLPEEFTNWDLSPPRATRKFDGGHPADARVLDEGLKTQLITKRYFTDEDFEDPRGSKLHWFVFDQSSVADRYYQRLTEFTGDALTLDFEFDYRFWNKNKKGMQLTTLREGEEGTLALPTKKTKAVLLTKQFLLSERFSDFIVKCGDKSFHTHRMIIADKSVVFAAMLEQPMKEMKEGRLVIDDFSPEVVEEFLRFIYTGNANVADYAMDLYKMGHKYEISDLKDVTENALIDQLNGSNLADISGVGKLYNSAKLMGKCYSFFKLKRSSLLKVATDVEKYSDFMLKFALE